ncbi:MAG: hypothetical protein L0Z73_16980 [Gammaproteobacteria bacterium]|nr:hypothetical protein [Gammaproteobacteria bacterium]
MRKMRHRDTIGMIVHSTLSSSSQTHLPDFQQHVSQLPAAHGLVSVLLYVDMVIVNAKKTNPGTAYTGAQFFQRFIPDQS